MKNVVKVFLLNAAAGAGAVVGLIGGMWLSAEMVGKLEKKKEESKENVSTEEETA